MPRLINKNYKHLDNKRYYEKGRVGCFRHRWLPEEDELVLKHEICDREIAKITHHSVKAIQTRRAYLQQRKAEQRFRFSFGAICPEERKGYENFKDSVISIVHDVTNANTRRRR